MFTLAELAYSVCAQENKLLFDSLVTPPIDVQPCCEDVKTYMKNEAITNVSCDYTHASKHKKRKLSCKKKSFERHGVKVTSLGGSLFWKV